VLNETAVRTFGMKDPLNSEIFKNDTMHIIGVVKDFHFSSLEESIEPMMFRYDNNILNIVLKISGNDIHNVLQKVENIIKEFDPEYVMEYVVLDDYVVTDMVRMSRWRLYQLCCYFFVITRRAWTICINCDNGSKAH